MNSGYPYETLLNELETRIPTSSTTGIATVRARKARIEIFALSALGNVLAEQRGWSIRGMDAIDFALIAEYSWYPNRVRNLSPANKWLALHQDLQKLEFPREAQSAWDARYANTGAADLLEWTINPLGLPPIDTSGLSLS
ncbi:hypothetical protein L4D93_006761 [Pseudomonas aeruginosa]|nr:hypothetical protein [Pseudomonas aeruginosa]